MQPSTKAPLPSNPLCKAVDVLHHFMLSKQYALCNGSIYRKAPESCFTYVYCCGVKEFVMRSLQNSKIANVLAQHVNNVISLLSNPACRLIKPIMIDYNLIEVQPRGTCFHIAGKFFKKHVKMRNEGVSPRAFVKHEYLEDRVPYPRPFIDGIYQLYFYQFFLHFSSIC